MNHGTRSGARSLGLAEGDYIVRADPTSTVDVLPDHASSTHSLARITKNAMMPLLFGLASFGSPAVPGVRRVFSDAAISRSAVADYAWLLVMDAFQFTEEAANPEEVRALNALLSLPVSSGLELDLFE
jgi:hypothetical protein